MRSKTTNAVSLLGGAVAGALAMYLLDPEAGERRRHQIAETGGDTARSVGGSLRSASHSMSPLWERVSDTARSVGTTLAASAGVLGHGIAEKYADARDSRAVSHLGDHVSDFGDRVSRGASSFGGGVADRFHAARAQAGRAASAPAHWFRHEEESHVGAYAATGVGTLVLGAGLMYLLDPTRGKQRRARVVDQATSIVNRTGRTFRQVGQDVRNRTAGHLHSARQSFESEDAVGAEKLLQRVRSELGHVVSHASAIQVMTDNHGRVTLHGKVLASEADELLSTVKGVGGVNEVINLLSVKETEQQMNDSFGSPATSGSVTGGSVMGGSVTGAPQL